ncbi:MAG TPA: hypothetical protein VKM94_21885, partial [Blastocatellia bacterium]|nr:hypothetical protein [Blastocatellia bacterium]
MEKQTQQSHETNPVVRSFQGERGVARSGVGGTIIGLQQSAGNRAVLGLLNRRLRRSDSSSPEGNNHHSAASESSQVAKKVLHAKLRVSQPTDPSEIEADRVAEQVMSMPEPSASNGHGMQTSTAPATPAARTAPIAGTAPVARSAPVAASAPAGSAPVATKPIQQAQPNVIQREADNDKRDNARLGVVPPFGGGAPLDESSRNFFEPRFARDLSNV